MRLPRTATVAIAVLTAAAWLLIALLGADSRASVVMGVIPARLSGYIYIVPAVPAWLTPLSSTLVHGGAVHLVLNLLMLVLFGTKFERILGAGGILTLYVVGAYAAAIAQWLSATASPTPMIGASGAISAIIGAFALTFGRQKPIVRSPGLNRALNALWLLAAWIVLQMMTGVLAGTQGFLLATPAHIGGFVAGLLLERPLLLWHYRKA
jgi:membrane associated rhomboid family serine protease